jgi:hypothetical protein
LTIAFDLYLSQRFGDNVLSALKNQAQEIHSKYYSRVKIPLDEDSLKHAMARLKKEKLWKTGKESKKRSLDDKSIASV